MTYLYVGLGIAMITGITAMMKISNNINKVESVNVLLPNDYFQSSLPQYDRKIMNLLSENSLPSSNICDHIKSKITNPIYEDGEIFLSTGTQTPSNSALFNETCVLVSNKESHRVLITKQNFNEYSFFSCYLKNQPFCNFEINK